MTIDLSNQYQTFRQLVSKSQTEQVYKALRQAHSKIAYLYIKALKLADKELMLSLAKVWKGLRYNRIHTMSKILEWYEPAKLECSHTLEKGKSPIEMYTRIAKQVIKNKNK